MWWEALYGATGNARRVWRRAIIIEVLLSFLGLGFNLFGDMLRDILAPRLRGEGLDRAPSRGGMTDAYSKALVDHRPDAGGVADGSRRQPPCGTGRTEIRWHPGHGPHRSRL